MRNRSTPLIRRAAPADAGLLAELGARTFSETFAADNSDDDMNDYLAASFGLEQQGAELSDPNTTFLVGEIDGIAVGYAMLRAGEVVSGVRDQEPIELVRFYVSREWQGRGIGEVLMRACIDEARQENYLTLWLGVWEHNSRARAFYRKWNFRDVGAHVFQLGSDSQNDIVMERAL